MRTASSLRFGLILLVLILLAYWQALRVSFLSDDFVLLSAARLKTLPEMLAVDPNWFFYRPLGALVWWCEYWLFGLRGAFYHVFSLGLHWLNSLLVVVLARRFLPSSAALGAGFIFALLPLHTETVTWLACQYDLLATCGYLVALICIVHWVEAKQHPQTGRANRFWFLFYLAAIVAFQFSLWSKETAFTFPLVAVIILLLLPKPPQLRQVVLAILPFCLLLALNLFQRYLAWGRIGGYNGAALLPADLPQALGRTVLTLLAPLNQLVFPAWLVLCWTVVVGGLLVGGVVFSHYRKAMFMGLGWLVLTLVPVLGLLPVGADMQNARVLYLPSVGFCLLLASCVNGKRETPFYFRPPFLFVLAGLLALQFQLEPWVVAGQNAGRVVQEFHRLAPRFLPDSRVSIVNLPDNYKGAYVYRLGFNHAYGHFFQQTFALEQTTALAPLRYDLRGNEAQVEFGFDRATKRWGVFALRSVGTDFAPSPDSQRWNIATCPADWRSATCESGAGASGWLESPSLTQTHVGWYEVTVLADVPASGVEGALFLEWRNANDVNWKSSQASTFNLPTNGGRYAYTLALNPAEGGLPLDNLRVQLDRGTVRGITLRAVQ